MQSIERILARISHKSSARGGGDGLGYKASRPSATQAYLTVRRGARGSATQETSPYPPPQQEICEKCGQGMNALAPFNTTLQLDVFFTGASSTRKALREASRLAAGIEASIRVIVLKTVPYPLPLDTPPIAARFARKRVLRLVNRHTTGAGVLMCYCRDEVDAVPYLLKSDASLFCPDSIFVIAGKKRRWFPTKEQRIARKLEELGRHVVFVDGGKHV